MPSVLERFSLEKCVFEEKFLFSLMIEELSLYLQRITYLSICGNMEEELLMLSLRDGQNALQYVRNLRPEVRQIATEAILECSRERKDR